MAVDRGCRAPHARAETVAEPRAAQAGGGPAPRDAVSWVRGSRDQPSSMTTAVPPAASMASRAAPLNACACTVSFFDRAPLARTLTGMSLRLPRPLAFSASRVTSSPASKRRSRSWRLTACVCVRNGSKGIDFFMCGPRSLRIRMWMGIWPPSKLCRVFEPAREPAPFWPRPEVLPVPEPSPRPMRLRALREPGAGLSVCRPIRGSSSAIGDLHQVAHAMQHAARLLVVLDLDGVADAAQAE